MVFGGLFAAAVLAFVLRSDRIGPPYPIDSRPTCDPLHPRLASNRLLTVDESHDSFSKSVLRTRRGVVRVRVLVPHGAKRMHGIALDGGQYNHVIGASVKAGRETQLTFAVTPGRYTIYDPVGRNRRKGYRTELIVSRQSAPQKPCRRLPEGETVPVAD